MCYAIPGKIVKIKENTAVLDYFGEQRNVYLDQEVRIGDYAYAQGGVLINVIEAKDAEEILKFWEKKFFELKEIDKENSQVEDIKASTKVLDILQKVNLNNELSKEELLFLLQIEDKNELKLIYETANNVRQKEHDNACCVHGIIEFSNYCKNDCHYCGIRCSHDIQRYRLDIEEIVNITKTSIDLGFKAFVLQSGEDYWYDEAKLIEIVKRIRKLNVLVFLSIGVRSKNLYEKLYRAGARGVLLRFESSDKELFEKQRQGTSFDERVQLIKDLKNMNYIIATGFLVGIGEKMETIVDNILLTKELGADVYSFGPVIPFTGEVNVEKDLILKIIAVSRFIDKKSKILVTSALETLDASARKEGLMAGENSLMLNVTPKRYKNLYHLYPGRKDEEIVRAIDDTVNLLYSIGRAPTDLGI